MPKRYWIILTLLTALSAGLLATAQAQASERASLLQQSTPTPEYDPNAACVACHSIKGRTLKLPSGDELSLEVDYEAYKQSVHGQKDIPCTGCHTNIIDYPHPAITAYDHRDFQLDRYTICRECHSEQYEATLDSMHADALAGGNRDAAICTDCHGSHDIADPRTPRHRISQTCSKCHAAIFEQYKNSVHGAALLEESNPDVPTCVDCHGVHSIHDPTTAQFRLTSPEMCGKCHADEERMAKYGISTAVFDTYVAEFHGTTVTLFERESPDQPVNTAVCYDCHGIHNIKAVTDPEATVVKENLLETCRRCHPDADANFPTAWVSHYIPDREHNPLVYFINLFYAIVIPLTIGGMVAFNSLDFIHRLAERRRKRAETGPEVKEDE